LLFLLNECIARPVAHAGAHLNAVVKSAAARLAQGLQQQAVLTLNKEEVDAHSWRIPEAPGVAVIQAMALINMLCVVTGSC
jgi:hypothetical protein